LNFYHYPDYTTEVIQKKYQNLHFHKYVAYLVYVVWDITRVPAYAVQ